MPKAVAKPREVAGRSSLRRVGLSLLIGGLIALGQAPFGLWPLALVGLILAMHLALGDTRFRTAFWRGFWIGFGYSLVTFNWLVEPFLVDAARHGWIAPFAISAMAAGFGLFWGLGFGAAVHMGKGSGWNKALMIVVGWVTVELGRSYLFTGFPWALLGYIWIETPVYQWAEFVGPHGITMATLCVAAVLSFSWKSRSGLLAGAGAGICALVWIVGATWLQDTHPTGDTTIRLVQPNAPQHLKWDREWRDVFFDRQLEFTAADSAPDIVIWPEVAVTFDLESGNAPYDRIAAAARGKPVILGGQRISGRDVYNSLIVLAEGAPQSLYDKHHLVPFGEYFPGGRLAERLGLSGLAQQLEFGFASGAGPQVLRIGDGPAFLPMICYEAIFPNELRKAGPDRPDFILHLTNDAWFGEFSGPYQHLAQAQARAIEFGLPVVRVANTGISAMISADGDVLAHLPLGEQGWLDARLPPSHRATLYWKYGDIFVFVALIATIIGLIKTRRSI